MRKEGLLPGVLPLILLAAQLTVCGLLEVGIEATPTSTPPPPPSGPSLTSTPPPPPSEPTPTSSLPVFNTPLPSSLPPGLVFGNGDGLWKVGEDGTPLQILDRSDILLSPDGSQALYTLEGDLWLIDLTAGEQHNLTHTPDRLECCPRWWPARPDTLIFGSWPQDADLGPSTGFLTAVRLDGSGYRVLEEGGQSNALPDPAPNGRTIAYDRGGTAWLYDWDAGPRPFDPAAYGLPVQKIASPAWSPDGKRLAWVVGGDFGEGWRLGVGLFDLEAGKALLLHPYEPLGVGGWPGGPVWSPDGQWLAYPVWPAASPEEAGLCVFRADGVEEHCLRPGSNPVWSPDGRWLAFSRESTIWLAEVGRWEPQEIAADAWPVVWLEAVR